MEVTAKVLDWLAQFSPLLTSQDLLGLVTYVVAVVTVVTSIVTFIIKLRERRERTRPRLAVSRTSWDARTQWPVIRMPVAVAPFPFISANLGNREPGPKGWFTVTELRIWNAGDAPLWAGPSTPNVDVRLEIAPNVGPYEVRSCLTNDTSLRLTLGRTRHSPSGRKAVPIYFDKLTPRKGVLVQVWSNSEDGAGISLKADVERAGETIIGTHHPINPNIVSFMSNMTLWLLLPAAALTVYSLWEEQFVLSLVSGTYTWSLIASTYFYFKLMPMSPADLGFRNADAKVLFYKGPG